MTPLSKPPHRRKKRKRSHPRTAGASLAQALKKLGLTDQAKRLEIIALWREVVGNRIAQRTKPHMFHRGVLTIKASSAPWQNELTYLEQDILTKLNEKLGRKTVRALRIVAGTLPKNLNSKPVLPKLGQQDAATIQTTSYPIEDHGVRKQFESFMDLALRARR